VKVSSERWDKFKVSSLGHLWEDYLGEEFTSRADFLQFSSETLKEPLRVDWSINKNNFLKFSDLMVLIDFICLPVQIFFLLC